MQEAETEAAHPALSMMPPEAPLREPEPERPESTMDFDPLQAAMQEAASKRNVQRKKGGKGAGKKGDREGRKRPSSGASQRAPSLRRQVKQQAVAGQR